MRYLALLLASLFLASATQAIAIDKELQWTHATAIADGVTMFNIHIGSAPGTYDLQHISLAIEDVPPDSAGIYRHTVDLPEVDGAKYYVVVDAQNIEFVSPPSNERKFIVPAAPVQLGIAASLATLFYLRKKHG